MRSTDFFKNPHFITLSQNPGPSCFQFQSSFIFLYRIFYLVFYIQFSGRQMCPIIFSSSDKLLCFLMYLIVISCLFRFSHLLKSLGSAFLVRSFLCLSTIKCMFCQVDFFTICSTINHGSDLPVSKRERLSPARCRFFIHKSHMPTSLFFYAAGCHSANNIFLPDQIYDNDRNTGQNNICKDEMPPVFILSKKLIHCHCHWIHLT